MVMKKDGNQEDYALMLEEGVSQKGVLLPKNEHPALFYKFALKKPEKWEGSIVISASALRGGVTLAVNNNDKVPQPDNHIWYSKTSTLEISSTDKKFLRQGTYYIGVFVDWELSSTKDLHDLIFTLRYQIKESFGGEEKGPKRQPSHVYLTPLTPYKGQIEMDDVHYFEAEVFKNDLGITIFKQTDVGEVDLYVSLGPNLKYPSEEAYNLTTKFSYQNSLKLSVQDIQKACGDSSDVDCPIYIAVILRGTYSKSYYQLSIKRDYMKSEFDFPVALQDGLQAQYSLPRTNMPALFYYYAEVDRHSVVTVTSPGKEILILGKRQVVKVGSGLTHDLNPPTDRSYEVSSRQGQNFGQGLAHITMPAGYESNSTVVVLAVYFQDPSRPDSNDKTKRFEQVKDANSFTILVSSQITDIYSGTPFYGAVPEDKYMYFSFFVFRTKCTLLITMTTLDDGDPDLVVSYGENHRPTILEHEFASISKQKTEVIEISNLDIYPRDDMSGTWVIGVYGRTASAFTLTVVYEDDKMVELTAGVPFEMFLKSMATMQFKYFHEHQKDLEIRLDKFSGEMDAYIVAVDNKDLASNLPNKNNYAWRIKSDEYGVLKINVTEKKACYKCLYVIGLEAATSSKFSIIVTEGETKFITIQSGVTYQEKLKSKSSKTFVFSSRNNDEAALSVHLLNSQLYVLASQNPLVNMSNAIWRTSLSKSNPTTTLKLSKADVQKYNQTTIFDGNRYVPSEPNSFYISFSNPLNSQAEFTFTAVTKDSNILLKSGSIQKVTIEPYNTTSFLYYYSQDGDYLKFMIDYKFDNFNQSAQFDKPLSQGLPVIARFWPESSTAGLGEVVELNQEQIIANGINSFRQVLTTLSRKGKYNFEVENSHRVPLKVAVKVLSNAATTVRIDQDSQHGAVLTPGKSEDVIIPITYSGMWYFWILACSGDVEVNVLDTSGKKVVGKSALSSDSPYSKRDYFLNTTINNGDMPTIKIINKNNKNSHYYMASSQVHERVKWDFSPLNDTLPINYELSYSSKGSKIKVKLSDYVFGKIEVTDILSYHVYLCPDTDEESKNNLCTLKGACKLVNAKKFANEGRKKIEATFEKVRPGTYYLQAYVNLQHISKLVRMVPYETVTFEVKETVISKVSSMIWTILFSLGMVIIVVFACVKCFKKLQVFGEEKGFEIEMFSKKKGYDMLGAH